MNRVISTMLFLAGIVALMATFVVPWDIAQRHFGLHSPWPSVIGAGFLCTALFGLFRWLIHLQRKERRVLATSHHPVFGEVRRLKDHWEASAPLTDGGTPIEIWGDESEPVPSQVSTFEAIRERYPDLLASSLDCARTSFASPDFSLLSGDLHLDSIYLAADSIGSFDLSFSIPAHERHIPWGITVQFVDFTIDEISDNH